MPVVQVQNGVRVVCDGKLVISEVGAPCRCGCVGQNPVPECIRVTLELVETGPVDCYSNVSTGSRPVRYNAPPPSGVFVLSHGSGGPDAPQYDFVDPDVPRHLVFCDDGSFWGLRELLRVDVGLVCATDPLDGVIRFGVEFARPAVAVGTTAFQFVAATSIAWTNPCRPVSGWVNESRPGSGVLAEGETALTGWPSDCDTPTARYRVSWARVACPGPEPTGACCKPDGSCSALTASACSSAGGTYAGDDVACIDADCPQPLGACCTVDGTCTDGVLQADCPGSGFWTPNVTCADVDCNALTGACCLPSGDCVEGVTRAECLALSSQGRFSRGIGCLKIRCDPISAELSCCIGGVCTSDGEAECAAKGGRFIIGGCTDPCSAFAVTAGDFF